MKCSVVVYRFCDVMLSVGFWNWWILVVLGAGAYVLFLC